MFLSCELIEGFRVGRQRMKPASAQGQVLKYEHLLLLDKYKKVNLSSIQFIWHGIDFRFKMKLKAYNLINCKLLCCCRCNHSSARACLGNG